MMIEPTEEHLTLMNAWKEVIGEQGADIPVEVILCLLAQLVGNVMGLLDATKYTSELALEMVLENIVIGNQELLASLSGAPS